MIGYALKLVLAPVLEGEAGAGHEVFDGLGYEYFRCFGVGCDPRADTDTEAADLPVDHFALAGVDACAGLDSQVAHSPGDFECAVDGSGRPIEARKEAIAGGVDLEAAPPVERRAHGRMMP